MLPKVEKKKFNLEMPVKLHQEVMSHARPRMLSFVAVVRQAISIWLLIAKSKEVVLTLDGKKYKVVM